MRRWRLPLHFVVASALTFPVLGGFQTHHSNVKNKELLKFGEPRQHNDPLISSIDSENEFEHSLARRSSWHTVDHRLHQDHPTMRHGAPQFSRKAKISHTDAGTLQINLSAAGLGGSSLVGTAFSVAWFSVVVPATFTSAGTALFMLPFWAAGGLVAKSSVVDPLTSMTLEIGEYAWNIRKTIAGRKVMDKSGPTKEIDQAETYVSLYRDNVPAQYEMILHGPDVKFGTGLGKSELERLQQIINEHLDEMRNRSDHVLNES